MALSLVQQYDMVNSTSVGAAYFRARLAQAILNRATYIANQPGSTPQQAAWADDILSNPGVRTIDEAGAIAGLVLADPQAHSDDIDSQVFINVVNGVLDTHRIPAIELPVVPKPIETAESLEENPKG